MRRMSFSMTMAAFLDGRKTVTRRLGWWGLGPGDRLIAVEKAMGLKRGEKMVSLGEIEIVSARAERLGAISATDCKREGFGYMQPSDFVDMFCEAMRCKPDTIVNRIEFVRL